MAQAHARPHDLQLGAGDGPLRLLDGGLLVARRSIRHEHDLATGWRVSCEPLKRPVEIVRPVGRRQNDRGRRRRWLVEPRRNRLAGAVPDLVPYRHVRRVGRCQLEVHASIDDSPTGRLDLGAELVGSTPVPVGAGFPSCMREIEDVLW